MRVRGDTATLHAPGPPTNNERRPVTVHVFVYTRCVCLCLCARGASSVPVNTTPTTIVCCYRDVTVSCLVWFSFIRSSVREVHTPFDTLRARGEDERRRTAAVHTYRRRRRQRVSVSSLQASFYKRTRLLSTSETRKRNTSATVRKAYSRRVSSSKTNMREHAK